MKLTQFQEKALDYKKHIVLSANAGSGKTFVLAKRFVNILVNENISLSSIVAITFTEKAAAELFRKISDEIETQLHDSANESVKQKLSRLREQLVSAKISTIHSFCIEILRELSVEAGLDANFVPIDQNESDELINLSINEFINSKLTSGDKDQKFNRVVHILGGLSQLNRSLTQAFSNRKSIEVLQTKIYSKTKEESVKYFNLKFEEVFEAAVISHLESVFNIIEKINSVVLSNEPENEFATEIGNILNNMEPTSSPNELLANLIELKSKILTGKNTLRLQKYLKKKELLEGFTEEEIVLSKFFNDADYFAGSDHSENITAELVRFGRDFLEIYNDVFQIYSEKKRVNGFLDFEDLLIKTEKLLKNEDVINFLSSKFKYIMIDEYQDTNEIQYNIFMPILNYLKHGNLFVVGDDKQSIYMFRNAELEIFQQTKNEIINSSSSESFLELPHSFRVSPKIAAFVNGLFSNLFADADTKYNEVDYNDLISTRKDIDTGEIEFLFSDSDDISESELIARKIQSSVLHTNAEVPYSDIAVLTRKRESFKILEKTFVKYNIPYTILGGKGFYQRQVIQDVYNYLKFVSNTNNDKSLIAILRSPFFTIADPKIFSIGNEKGRTFWQKLMELAVHDNSLQSVVDTLQAHINEYSYLELPVLIRSIINSTGYRHIISDRINGEQELANLEKLIDLARSFNSRGFKSTYDFVEFIGESIDKLDDEAQATATGEENTVKLMTVHRAKGLEFNSVFLFRCNEKQNSSSVRSKSINVDKEFGIQTKLPSDNNYFGNYKSAPVTGAYNYTIQRKELAEEKRLLYVAITRAKNNLYITADIQKKIIPNSFADLITSGLQVTEFDKPIRLSSELKIMDLDKPEMLIDKIPINYDILITNKIEVEEGTSNELSDEATKQKNISIKPVIDNTKNEIISATKIAVFNQCPLKYHLIYNLGYSKLFKKVKLFSENYNFNYKEDDDPNLFADIKGKIIHDILERELTNDEMGDRIEKLLAQETFDGNRNEIKNEITDVVNRFVQSDEFKQIQQYESYEIEYEIYSKESDYYLFGIIDRLIVTDNEIIIVDYKTDLVNKSNSEQKILSYEPQFVFYAYLASKKFSNIEKFGYRLMFVREPSLSVIKNLAKTEVLQFGESIKNIVNEIRAEHYRKNLDHCSKCNFAVNQKCIIQ